jgi:ABC-type Fe3+-hydroxamate transport system substrate-binding protein
MVKRSSNGKGESELFRLYDLLDRYEELIEDMAELGVNTASEAERKIEELNEQIDALEENGKGKSH